MATSGGQFDSTLNVTEHNNITFSKIQMKRNFTLVSNEDDR